MARCLQTLILARTGTLAAEFSSIEEYLGRNTAEYYDVLATVGAGSWNPQRNTRAWIRFCLKAHFQQATTLLRRMREMHQLWDVLEIEARKRGLPERCIFALSDAAIGLRIRNVSYRKVAEISDQVASRDLKTLVDEGLLVSTGEKRGRFYRAAPLLVALRETHREKKKNVDPFSRKR
jgi:Fic family protein